MALRVGLGLFTAQLPPGSSRTFTQEYRDVVELSRLAERVGFDSVWVSEHHGAGDGYMPSLLPVLSAIATVTERVQLATGVMLTPFHHPLRLAEDAATVDLLSGGRLLLGLGLGWREEEFRMFDVPIRQRVRRTSETVDILRRAWTGERFSYDGRAFPLTDVRVTPAPERDGGPPIYLGGHVEAACRRAGAIGDGYIRSRSGLDAAATSLSWADEGARDAGKDPEGLGFALLQNTFVWDEGEAWPMVRDGVAHQLGVYPAWYAGADAPGRGFEVTPPPDDKLRETTPAGDPQAVLAALRPIVEAFSGRREFHLVVRLQYPGMSLETAAHAVELFAGSVLPGLRAEESRP